MCNRRARTYLVIKDSVLKVLSGFWYLEVGLVFKWSFFSRPTEHRASHKLWVGARLDCFLAWIECCEETGICASVVFCLQNEIEYLMPTYVSHNYVCIIELKIWECPLQLKNHNFSYAWYVFISSSWRLNETETKFLLKLEYLIYLVDLLPFILVNCILY